MAGAALSSPLCQGLRVPWEHTVLSTGGSHLSCEFILECTLKELKRIIKESAYQNMADTTELFFFKAVELLLFYMLQKKKKKRFYFLIFSPEMSTLVLLRKAFFIERKV